MTMMRDLVDEMIAGGLPQRTRQAVYVADGDCLIYFDRDEAYHRVRVDGDVTVYVSDADPDRLVGCQLKDFAKNLRRYGGFGVEIGRGGQLKLGLLFMLSGIVPDASERTRNLFDSDLARRDVAIPELCGV